MINEEIAKWFGKTQRRHYRFRSNRQSARWTIGSQRYTCWIPLAAGSGYRTLHVRRLTQERLGFWRSIARYTETANSRGSKKTAQRRIADFRHNLGSARLDHLGRDRM